MRKRDRGFTYLALLFVVAIAGIVLAGAATLWSTESQRAKERELIFIGNQFSDAIESYYLQTPGAIKRYPKTLNDLLMDQRQAATVRHLRKLYRDPMTLKLEWGLVRAADGGVKGVFSLSDQQPLKRLPLSDKFGSKQMTATRYSEWQFVYEPTLPPARKNSRGLP